MEFEIRPAVSTSEIDTCRTLMKEYATWLQDGICLQGFAEEIAGLPGKYQCILVASVDAEPAGCVAFRKFDDTSAEAKRLWVRPQFRKHGVGVALLNRVMEEIQAAGYQRMLFDTLPKMESALRIYEALEFKRIEAYCESNLPGGMCFEKRF
jgi:ribosomal protein S18 acetylase RimI-like enzyme